MNSVLIIIEKARQILTGNYNGNIADLKGKTWEDVIIEAEKFAFFKGAIRFLFRKENGEYNWEDFDIKWGNAQTIFCKEGLSDVYKKDALANRILLSYCQNWTEQIESKFIFDISSSVWKNNILLNEVYDFPVNQLLMGEEIKNDLSLKTDKDTIIWLACNKLVNTAVISWMQNNQQPNLNKLRVRLVCGEYRFYKQNAQNGILLSNRDDILKDSGVEILNSSKVKIDEPNMLYGGWTSCFRFKYNNKEYTFQWQPWNWIDLYDGETRLYYDKEEVKTTFDGSEVKNSDDFIVKLQGCIHSWQQYSSPDNPNKS